MEFIQLFEDFVYEASGEVQTLHFKDIYSYLLFKCEYSGQISDGKYENTRPTGHYKWLFNTECVIDGKEYYEGGSRHAVKYTFKDWDSYIKKALNGQTFNYDWTARDYYMCKLASILSGSVVKGIVDANRYAYENIADTWGKAAINGKDYNAMVESKPFYKTNSGYASAVSSIDNEQTFNKFVESTYDIKDFIAARESAERTMNLYND